MRERAGERERERERDPQPGHGRRPGIRIGTAPRPPGGKRANRRGRLSRASRCPEPLRESRRRPLLTQTSHVAPRTSPRRAGHAGRLQAAVRRSAGNDSAESRQRCCCPFPWPWTAQRAFKTGFAPKCQDRHRHTHKGSSLSTRHSRMVLGQCTAAERCGPWHLCGLPFANQQESPPLQRLVPPSTNIVLLLTLLPLKLLHSYNYLPVSLLQCLQQMVQRRVQRLKHLHRELDWKCDGTPWAAGRSRSGFGMRKNDFPAAGRSERRSVGALQSSQSLHHESRCSEPRPEPEPPPLAPAARLCVSPNPAATPPRLRGLRLVSHSRNDPPA